MRSFEAFRSDQREDIDWLTHRTDALLVLPTGYGKTAVALQAFKNLRQIHPGWRMLVVSTKKIVEHTWPTELTEWSQFEHFTYASGRKNVHVMADIVGINFESLDWYYDQVDRDPTMLPEVLVIDEISKMKDPSAQRVKRHTGLRKAGYVQRYQRRWGLTATPNAEGYTSFWAQEACVSMRRRLGVNITEFRNRYCQPDHSAGRDENGRARKLIVGAWGEQEIHKHLAPITLVSRRDKYMDLEEPVYDRISVPWAPDAQEEYDTLETEFLLDLRDKIEIIGEERKLDLHTIEDLEAHNLTHALAPNMGVLFNKLRQACSGFVYDAHKNARLLSDPSAKLGSLKEYRDRVAGVPLLIFYNFNGEREHIRESFPDFQIGLPDSLDAWNAGDIPGMVCQYQSTSHGLNLQKGTNIIVHYALPWSYELWWQSVGRVHRTGQTRRVTVSRFERPDSIESDMWDRLQGKGKKLSQFISTMRGRHDGEN